MIRALSQESLHGFAHSRLTTLFGMASWPLEITGSVLLLHYGDLFSGVVPFSRDWRAIISQIMPNAAWGVISQILGALLLLVCVADWLRDRPCYGGRIGLGIVGLMVWSILFYSCLRADVPFRICRLYGFFVVAQTWVLALLYAKARGQSEHTLKGGPR